MIKSASEYWEENGHKVIIDLDGPDGNAFCLLANAKRLGRELGYSKEQIEAIQEKMRLGNYLNLLKEFNDAFGDIVELITDNSDILEALENGR